MCGIDELFSSNSLSEKTEPIERFNQALDEYDAADDFRKFLKDHFSSSWERELGPIEKIEEALKYARNVVDLSEKISVFVQAIIGNSFDGWMGASFNMKPAEPIRALQQNFENNHPSRITFAKDVAARVFPESPYGFYQCFKAQNDNFVGFILYYAHPYYGESCYLTSLVFNDKHLEAAGANNRHDILWGILEYMLQGDQSVGANLEKLFCWERYASVPTRETLLFSEAFDYLSTWLKVDALLLDYLHSSDLLNSTINYLCDREAEIIHLNADSASGACGEAQGFETWARKWFVEQRYQLSKAWCCSVNLEGLSDNDFEVWALKAYDCFLPLYNDLSQERAAHLIAWGIEEDLTKWLDPNFKCDCLLDSMLLSGLWYVSTFREVWRSQLTESINALPLTERLSILGLRFGWNVMVSASLLPQYISLPDEFHKEIKYGSRYEFRVENNDLDWWNSLLRLLPDEDSFPKELYPDWTLKALSRFGYSEGIAPHADKSLGIVRGGAEAGGSELTAGDIDSLIKIMEHFSPEKAMRHRLLLLRSSQQPYATENLDIDRSSLRPETMSEILQTMSIAHFDHESRRQLLYGDEWLKEEHELLFSIRAWIAQYCLSRLKLRKGEKAGKDFYKPEQVVEPSPIWRKAYLKVLEELGVDLQGKIHKAVFFIRKFDPVEEVREVAKTCYKAVRREHNKSEAAEDIRRGLTAAYWWLLLAQRHALGLPVNKEEAVKTRRRLLRRS